MKCPLCYDSCQTLYSNEFRCTKFDHSFVFSHHDWALYHIPSDIITTTYGLSYYTSNNIISFETLKSPDAAIKILLKFLKISAFA